MLVYCRKESIMKNRVLPLLLVALAVALFVGAPLLAEDKADKGNTHTGKVVSVSGNKLTMTGKDGKEHSHTLADNAKVTCDGKECKLSDLKAGFEVRVTTKDDDKNVATRIEARKGSGGSDLKDKK